MFSVCAASLVQEKEDLNGESDSNSEFESGTSEDWDSHAPAHRVAKPRQPFQSLCLQEYEEYIRETKEFPMVNTCFPNLQAIQRDPWIFVIPGLLSERECRALIRKASPYMKPSWAYVNGVFQEHPNRTSLEVRMRRSEAIRIQSRFARLLNVPMKQLETLKVARYENGGYFKPHNDGAGRSHSLFVYLNDVEKGGATLFSNFHRLDVEISGAGSSEVNGLYAATDATENCLRCFKKQGFPSGLIWFVRSGDIPGAWYIHTASGDCAYFHESADCNFVPTEGWKVYTGTCSLPGEEPPPKIRARGGQRPLYEPLRIKPQRGMGVLHFPCLTPDFGNHEDASTTHQSEVAVDEKFICAQWARYEDGPYACDWEARSLRPCPSW